MLISDELNIYPLAIGCFVSVSDKDEDQELIFGSGTWFWGSAGLSMQLCFRSFDSFSTVISTTQIWVRLPNFSLPLWNIPSLKAIGIFLGIFHRHGNDTK